MNAAVTMLTLSNMRSIGKVVKVNDLHDTATKIMTMDTHNKSIHILYTTMTQNFMYIAMYHNYILYV